MVAFIPVNKIRLTELWKNENLPNWKYKYKIRQNEMRPTMVYFKSWPLKPILFYSIYKHMYNIKSFKMYFVKYIYFRRC